MTDAVLTIVLIVIYILTYFKEDNGIMQVTRIYLKLPFLVLFWIHYIEAKQKITQMNSVWPKEALTP